MYRELGQPDDDNGLVKLNYVTSWFFECPNAENILSQLLAWLKQICETNMILLSMDGPNTFDSLQKHEEKVECYSLLNVGSCGLHMVHGAYKTGV